ncbi:hypothetical protein DSCA_52730 [Desulfosarcina alkanivorans]|uniref:Uncharacterized protein n=1 Tax=Desulfosarcina alkanivorans TaxID=571177 RepID=A0A5K7YTH0_9BACT|nr:hypothetical protein DSCA_52730 [Desulfosarcina alkanivorans]
MGTVRHGSVFFTGCKDIRANRRTNPGGKGGAVVFHGGPLATGAMQCPSAPERVNR